MAPPAPTGTLFERLWTDHRIAELGNGVDLLQIDRHLVHEVSSPVAFQQLAKAGRRVRAPRQTFATQDHILSTAAGRSESSFAPGAELVRFLRARCREHGIALFDVDDARQGIVHVIAAELGLVLPGSTVVCGDSHTATLGAFGALAWGTGTSEVAHVLATQTLAQMRPQPLQVWLEGRLRPGVQAKDIILGVLGKYGITAGVGHAVEYAGPAVRALSMEERMTVCNMSIELGARFGFVAPDDVTFDYLAGREYAPKGPTWDAAVAAWRELASAGDAAFAKVLTLDVGRLAPQVTWGTTPGAVVGIDEPVPECAGATPGERERHAAALRYMGLAAGRPLLGEPVDVVFIGSCTNSRLSDLRAAASLAKGRRVSPRVRALVVPGSSAVKRAAEAEGIDRAFADAGFEWREAGCSMCLALNDDVVPPGARCVSTSNRNFEGRQGTGARTHLASPLTAVASALAGCIADPRQVH